MEKRIDFALDIRHLTRVEGHGDIRVSVRDGRLAEADWTVVEPPRFFESMIRGMSADRAPFLTSRICGICSTSHFLATTRALERAMGITPPATAEKVRLLAMQGETLQSHALHLFFLALPDLLDAPDAMQLRHSHPELVRSGLLLKELGNELSIATTGRATHPVSIVVGGLSKAPDSHRLRELKAMIAERRPALDAAATIFREAAMPRFVRETEFVSLKGGGGYPSIGGTLVSSDGVVHDEDDYLLMTNEYLEAGSTSKFTRISRESCAAGALARFNNNAALLHPSARRAAAALGLAPGCHNPFMNSVAQLVECYHIFDEADRLIEELLDTGMTAIRTTWEPKAGRATGAVEAPRGILYHHMETDARGRVVRADCIIPTTQNNGNIRRDLHALAGQALQEGKSEQEAEKLCVMLVRAYDPCISCSVH